MRMHRISTDLMIDLGASSKLNAELPFLYLLRDEGRAAASRFANEHRAAIGKRSTFDIDAFVNEF